MTNSHRRVLVASPVASHPSYSGNSARVFQICNALEEIGCEVHFCLIKIAPILNRDDGYTMSKVWGSKFNYLSRGEICYGTLFQKLLNKFKRKLLPFTPTLIKHRLLDFQFCDGYVSKKFIKDFRQLVSKLNPDAIFVEYAILSKLTDNLPPRIIKVVDTHDRFTNRNQRLRKEGCDSSWVSLTEAQENKLLKRFDHVIAIQSGESRQFQDQLKHSNSKVHTIDILSSPTYNKNKEIPRNTIGYIGSSNPHNTAGLNLFLAKHWANIKSANPEAELHIAGIQEIAPPIGTSGIKSVGHVPNLDEFYQSCTFMINPCNTGTGLKIKSVEALQHGKPLVTTTEGVKGLEDSINRCVFVANLADESFALNCIRLLNNPTIVAKACKAAVTYTVEKRMRSLAALKLCITNNS